MRSTSMPFPNRPACRPASRGVLFALPLLLSILSLGCSSITVVVGEDRVTAVSEELQECGGVRFRLTVQQNLQGQDPVTVTIEATAAGGQIRFSSGDLDRIKLENIVSLELRALAVPPRAANCRFKTGEVFAAGPLVLTPVGRVNGDPAFAVPVKEFKKKSRPRRERRAAGATAWLLARPTACRPYVATTGDTIDPHVA